MDTGIMIGAEVAFAMTGFYPTFQEDLADPANPHRIPTQIRMLSSLHAFSHVLAPDGIQGQVSSWQPFLCPEFQDLHTVCEGPDLSHSRIHLSLLSAALVGSRIPVARYYSLRSWSSCFQVHRPPRFRRRRATLLCSISHPHLYDILSQFYREISYAKDN